MLKIKYGYKLELQTTETVKTLIDKTKNGKNVPSLELVEVVLV